MLAISSGRPVALLLGSGFTRLSGLVKTVRRIPYEQIVDDAHPACGLDGLEATVGTVDGRSVIVYPARIHLYKGFSAFQVASLVRHAHACGSRMAVFVGASGAVGNAEGLAVVTDHINLTGESPLVGWRHEGDSFVPMRDVYDWQMRAFAHEVAESHGIELSEGVYAEVRGPQLETPAEVRALEALGVSYVGMSLTLESIMAHALGMRVLALTHATNPAGATWVSHRSVRVEATSVGKDVETIVRGVLRRL